MKMNNESKIQNAQDEDQDNLVFGMFENYKYMYLLFLLLLDL